MSQCKIEPLTCRTCLSTDVDANNLYPLFIKLENTTLSVAQQLMECYSINMNDKEDDLPNIVCCNCFNRLQKAYEFKKLIDKSQESLKNLKCKIEDNGDISNFENTNILKKDASIKEDSKFIVLKIGKDTETRKRKKKIKEKNGNTTIFKKIKIRKTDTIFKFGYKTKKEPLTRTNNIIVKNDEDIKMYRCNYCKKNFKKIDEFNEHNEKEHKYSCEICERIFWSKMLLKRHLELIHSQQLPENFLLETCEECGKTFKRKTQLREHKKVHDGARGIKAYLCTFCGRKFSQETNLKVHVRTHTGEKPYNCHLCEKNFAQSSTLKVHLVYSHSFERKYGCDICGKYYGTNSHLTNHKRSVHNLERNYQCTTCLVRVKTPMALKRHLKIHGDYEIFCSVCQKGFHQKKNMRVHMRTHTGERPFKCEWCESAFSQRCSLKAHIQKYHPCKIEFSKDNVLLTNN